MSTKVEIMLDLLEKTPKLKKHISNTLYRNIQDDHFLSDSLKEMTGLAAVLFLIGNNCEQNSNSPKPCLVLNKRSKKVQQPGDLCFPGGRVSPRLDMMLSKTLRLPTSPLAKWAYWSAYRKSQPDIAQKIAFLFATSLRESFEEMRLNPFCVNFLGPLPPYRLTLTKRVIFPMAGWVSGQKRFYPNWEVEKLIYIPLEKLLNPSLHARYRLEFSSGQKNVLGSSKKLKTVRDKMSSDFPCFLHQVSDSESVEQEVLWGATYRMIVGFLELVFGFKPPEMATLRVVKGTLDENYIKPRNNRKNY